LKLTIQEIDAELEALEKGFEKSKAQYDHDRETLLRMKEFALRHTYRTDLAEPAAKPTAPICPKVPKTFISSGKMTDRQAIRDFLSGWNGDFTITDLIEASKKSGHPASKISLNVWHSVIYWLYTKAHFVEVVQPRQGNKPGTYRLAVGRNELLAPPRRKLIRGYPLQDIVAEGIKSYPAKRFGRKELTDFVVSKHPEHADRLTAEKVGAVLIRLVKHGIGARAVEHNAQGNTYEKL